MAQKKLVVDDFESYTVDSPPSNWQLNIKKNLVPITTKRMNDRQHFIVRDENGNKLVRATTLDHWFRILFTNGDQFDWEFKEYPLLKWDWRAVELPLGASEDNDDTNDTGGAVSVIFSKNWLGRPKIIKYTFSSALPTGTKVSYGGLKVIVVASALDSETGKWITIERNVVQDYKSVFGKQPPDRPLALMLWSDSDTMNSKAIVDFDNIELAASQGHQE